MIRRIHNLVAGRASTRLLRDIPRRRHGVCKTNTAGPGWGDRGPFIAKLMPGPYWVRRGKVTPSFLRACSSTGMPSEVLPDWHWAIAVGTVALGPRCWGAVFR